MKLSLNKFITVVLVGLALVSCSPEVPKQIAPPADGSEKVSEDNGGEVMIPKVDILFVIDNSGSMQTHQSNLAMNIGAFTGAFGAVTDLDYQIGVISTDDGSDGWNNGTDCCGKLIGNTKIVNNNTPQRDRILSDNILIGTNGSGTEKVFAPMAMALSERLLKTDNFGFLREDATLVTIFITDAEDNGTETAKWMHAGLVKLKKGDPSRVLGYGVIVPSWESSRCTSDDGTKPTKIEAYLGLVINGAKQTNIMSLCSRTFGTELAGLADDIVRQISSVMKLVRLPDVSTIKVVYGTEVFPQDVKKGWSYDPSRNAIILGKEINWKSQPKGTKIQVSYRTAKSQTDKP